MTGGDVTVIVPVWNGRALLERLLAGLAAQTQVAAEVLVVDDFSADGSAELAESMGARAIRMGARGGFAKAVNRGIRESRTPLVAIVNSDVEVAPDWLERLSAALAPDVWFAAPRILRAEAPDRIDGTYDAICRGGASCRVGHALPDGPLFREARPIWSAPMTAALFRAELFQQVGLLDERFEAYLEDVDFGVRCALAGFAGRYVPDAVRWAAGTPKPSGVFRATRFFCWPNIIRGACWSATRGRSSWRTACGAWWLCVAPEALRGCVARWKDCAGGRPFGRPARPRIRARFCAKANGQSALCSAMPAAIFIGLCTFYSPRVGQSDTWVRQVLSS